MKPETSLKKGTVVQLSPDCTNPVFGGCFMIVNKTGNWGAQGYIFAPTGMPPLQYFYRATWEEMEVIGTAAWEVE